MVINKIVGNLELGLSNVFINDGVNRFEVKGGKLRVPGRKLCRSLDSSGSLCPYKLIFLDELFEAALNREEAVYFPETNDWHGCGGCLK